MKNATIKSLLLKLKNREVSSYELVKFYLDEIKKKDKKLNAFVTVDEKGSIEQAKKADKLISDGQNLPLLGIPIALKDIFLTKGLKTTAGSKVLENYIPQYDGTVVRKLKDAGAVIIGKTNCDAWAHGSSGENSDFGSTKNPFNIDYVPGGSSSGSAVAVASDMALATTGTDTGGSIRLPASFCNVVGLKPTYGRVSRYGIISMASSMDSIGHFTKTVEDSAIFLKITAGKDTLDATTSDKEVPNYIKDIEKGVKGLRIGYHKQLFEEMLNPEISRLYKKTIIELKELGADIIPLVLPKYDAHIASYYIIMSSEVSSNLARYDGIRYGNSRDSFGEEAKRRIMLGTFALSAGYYNAYYKKAMQIRTALINDMKNLFFTKVDAIISPVSPTALWKIGEKVNDPLKMYLSDILTVTANLAGIPGLSVPAGFTNNGLPVGIQILGPQFSEQTLFQIGFAFEQKTQFYKEGPKL